MRHAIRVTHVHEPNALHLTLISPDGDETTMIFQPWEMGALIARLVDALALVAVPHKERTTHWEPTETAKVDSPS